MKNPLQSMLIFFALSLCALCTWQWYSQTVQRKEMTAIVQINVSQAEAIQSYTNTINNMDHQIAQMDVRLTELKNVVFSNNIEIIGLRQKNEFLDNAVQQYSNAFVTVQAQLKQAAENIRQQNDAIKSVVAERDEYVKRLNESIKERNDVVQKYNDLVKQVEEIQEKQQPKKK